ncbi:GNAT family N-acetyltransferase [Bacillus sp. V3]|nr:GNAT family N-acetyltransferase [Bacillus sp. V3]
MTLKLTKYKDINEFYKRVYPFLIKKEAENNLPLGLLNSIKSGSRYNNPLLVSAENEDGRIKGAFIMTPPHNLVSVLQINDNEYSTIAQELNTLLSEEGIEVPGFVSEKVSAEKLTQAWCNLKGCEHEIGMDQRIYKLDHVNDIELPVGKLIQPEEEHLTLLSDWIQRFTVETGVRHLTESEALERAEDMIANENYLYFWEADGKPVSMARGGRWTDNGITVNFVYTPKPLRKKGYASAVVAGLSSKLLEEYKFCTLYTDLENPTSNKIYMDIGYVPVCDSLMVNIK